MIFGKTAKRNTTQHPYTQLPILMASGLGRSGTTVLRNCIAKHPAIDCRNHESNYFQNLLLSAHDGWTNPFTKKSLPVSESEFWLLHQQSLLDLYWPGISSEPVTKKAIATYANLDPRGATGLGQAFKRSSVVYIIRNGIEVVSSYQAFKNFSHLPFEQVCNIWAFQEKMHQFVVDHPDRCTLIRFEWLVEDRNRFSAALKQAFSKIGLPMADECLLPLDKNYHPTKIKSEASDQLSERVNRWQLWTEEQRSVFAKRCGNLMGRLGFEMPWQK